MVKSVSGPLEERKTEVLCAADLCKSKIPLHVQYLLIDQPEGQDGENSFPWTIGTVLPV